MDKGNVLVVGYAGVGKSTLIKTVLGEEAMKNAVVGSTNQDFQVYENQNISFRLIDTTGIEPGVFKEQKAVNAVRKWSGNIIKAGIWSENSLYSEEIATFGASDYNQADAAGFITLYGLPIKVQALVDGK